MKHYNPPRPPAPQFDDDGAVTKAAEKKPRSESWWVKHAAPEARAEFMAAAAARDAEMRDTSPAWRSQYKPNQLTPS
jgi:hypothetical protein